MAAARMIFTPPAELEKGPQGQADQGAGNYQKQAVDRVGAGKNRKHPRQAVRRLHHMVAWPPDDAYGIIEDQQDGKGEQQLKRDVPAVGAAKQPALDQHPEDGHRQRTDQDAQPE
jgi:hypothetical protein